MLCPIIQLEVSEARYTIALCKSSVVANLFAGICSSQVSANLFNSGFSQIRGVSTIPGDMQFTFRPLSAHSHARVCVILTTAAFEQLYAACFCGWGTSNVAIDAVLMIFPYPCFNICLASS